MNARESYAYRLQAAADLAQSIGVRLSDLAPHGHPSDDALVDLRAMENSLDVISRYYVRDLEKTSDKLVPA